MRPGGLIIVGSRWGTNSSRTDNVARIGIYRKRVRTESISSALAEMLRCSGLRLLLSNIALGPFDA